MPDYPMTPEQEQEMRAVARAMLDLRPDAHVDLVAARLGDTVSVERRRQIAKEESLLRVLGVTEVHQIRVQDNLRAFFAAVSKASSTTYYTVMEEPIKQYWPFYCLVSTPGTRQLGKRPSMYGYFADPGEASQETQACYGSDIEYVTPEQFRRVHP